MGLVDNFEVKENIGLDLLAKQVVEGFIIGLHKSPFHGFSVEFAEHKAYNPGDSIKNIDWKVYARTDKLYTKNYEEETNLRCQLVIDISSSMFFPKDKKENKFKFSALAAASIMNLLGKQRDAYGLTLFDDKIEEHTRARNSTKHYNYLLSQLDHVLEKPSINKSSSVADALHKIADSIPKRSLVVIFSDMMDNHEETENIFDALQHLKHAKHEVILFHVVDKDKEIDFDYSNRPHLFIDMESGEKIKVLPHQIKDYYHDKMTQFNAAIKENCLKYKIDLVEADINEGFRPILEKMLVKRKSMRI